MPDGALHLAGAQGGAARLLGGGVYCISTLVFVGLLPLNSIACVYRGFGLQNAFAVTFFQIMSCFHLFHRLCYNDIDGFYANDWT